MRPLPRPLPGRLLLTQRAAGALLVAVVATYVACAPESPAKASLPPHVIVDDRPVPPHDGRRIEIHVTNPALSKEECRALIDGYRERGAPEGQVSVHKPSAYLKQQVLPYCVENFDGRGVTFNDLLFDSMAASLPLR